MLAIALLIPPGSIISTCFISFDDEIHEVPPDQPSTQSKVDEVEDEDEEEDFDLNLDKPSNDNEDQSVDNDEDDDEEEIGLKDKILKKFMLLKHLYSSPVGKFSTAFGKKKNDIHNCISKTIGYYPTLYQYSLIIIAVLHSCFINE